MGAGDGYVGADLVSRWYERNIRIFANLKQITVPGDRILILVGSGHAPILRELISQDPTLVLVDPLEFLPPPRWTRCAPSSFSFAFRLSRRPCPPQQGKDDELT
ncbi:hypothetical protein BH23GEM8_BH23GEM8_22270 [soil metagenome]